MGTPVTAVYVSCDSNQDIVQFRMDPATGALARVGAMALPRAAGWTEPHLASLRATGAPLAVNPSRTCLYAAMRTEPFRIISIRLDRQSGSIEPMSEAPLPAATPFLCTDRSGRYLLGASYGGNLLCIYAIKPDGSVAAEPLQLIHNITTPHCILFDQVNRFAYVAATGHSDVLVFRFDSKTGQLEHCGAPPAKTSHESSPRHLALHPKGEFLYAINETTATIDSFSIDPDTGLLKRIARVDPRTPEERASNGLGADLHLSPNGRFLYASERMRHTISVYAIGASPGQLSFVEKVQAPILPRSFQIDPSGRFLLAAGQGTRALTLFAIGPDDGRLTERATYEVGGRPTWIEIVTLPTQ